MTLTCLKRLFTISLCAAAMLLHAGCHNNKVENSPAAKIKPASAKQQQRVMEANAAKDAGDYDTGHPGGEPDDHHRLSRHRRHLRLQEGLREG